MKAPTISDRAMTITVNFIVSCRVGQVVFFSSAITSFTNLVGEAIVRTFGVSINWPN